MRPWQLPCPTYGEHQLWLEQLLRNPRSCGLVLCFTSGFPKGSAALCTMTQQILRSWVAWLGSLNKAVGPSQTAVVTQRSGTLTYSDVCRPEGRSRIKVAWMLSSPLAVCSTEGYPSLQFDTSRPTLSSPALESYGLQSRGTISSQLAGLTVSSPSLCSPADGKQEGRSGCESPAESNSFKKTRRGKRAGKNLKLRNAESELRRRSVDAFLSGDDSPRSWTPRSQVCLHQRTA